MTKRIIAIVSFWAVILPSFVFAQSDFNPQFIISDAETQNCNAWTRYDIQQFLQARGSFLAKYQCPNASGTIKSAADIIYEAAQTYQINPKFLLVTLQKEQSIVTDDSPTTKQLDWAAGYGICDSCSMNDPKLEKYRGFGKQVDNAAGIMRWYYDNKDTKSFIKKINTPTYIDNKEIIPLSWATAFLYTYTPHLHGNQNFWRIWQTWFGQVYPNGTILKSASSSDYYLLQDGKKRKFKNLTALITRSDPKLALTVTDAELSNYADGTEVAFPNYSILKTSNATYLLDYDVLRPFASDEVVRQLGYNPQEFIDVTENDLVGYVRGTTITTSTTAPTGVIYYITKLTEPYYYVKDGIAKPIRSQVVEANYKKLKIEKHTLAELEKLQIIWELEKFKDGTLLKMVDTGKYYVMEGGKKRPIADRETFNSLGYSTANAVVVNFNSLLTIEDGEPLYLNSSLVSAQDKYLGDSEMPVEDLFKSPLPAYLVAEYPTGRIVAGKNIDKTRSIAALVKILTAYEAVNQNFDLTKSTVYSDKKYSATNNSLNLKNGYKIQNTDLLTSILVESNNPGARMIAQNSGISTEKGFIAAINERIADWGADNTKIFDVSGLDKRNVSTPRDLLKIFVKSTKNDIIKNSLGKASFTLKITDSKGKTISQTVKNNNSLVNDKKLPYQILATKTGYTSEAGASLLMLIQNKTDKKQYVIITLGDTNYVKRFIEPDRITKMLISGKVKLTNAN